MLLHCALWWANDYILYFINIVKNLNLMFSKLKDPKITFLIIVTKFSEAVYVSYRWSGAEF